MSARIRGQEAVVSFAVAGIGPLSGSFTKIKDFTATPRTDLVETDYLGETFTDLDVQHQGWDFSFTLDEEDGKSLEYIAQLMSNEENNVAPASVMMQVVFNYRKSGEATKSMTFSDVVMKANDINLSGRKDYISSSYEGKAKRCDIK
jgi:hypothetical protein